MFEGRLWTRLLVGGLVAVAVLAGGAVIGMTVLGGTQSGAGSPRIGANASGAYAGIDGVNATREKVVHRGPETYRSVARVSLRPGTDQRRITIRETTSRRHETIVENDSVMTMYDRDTGVVRRFEPAGTTDPRTFGDRVERLFERVNVTDRTASATADGVSPLPVVPVDTARRATGASHTATLRLTYDGTTTVSGRSVYVLRLSATGDVGAAFEQTLWVDTERFFPVQRQTSWVANGEPVTARTTYSDITFDPGVTDDTFTFSAPPNTTAKTYDTPNRTVYPSAQRLAAATEASVPEPTTPGSLRLVAATETTGRIHGVGLRYANDTASVTVAKYDRTYPVTGYREIRVAGRNAAVAVGPTTSISWNCATYRYTVRGSGVSLETLREVAASTACG
ncbi:outer membrane lipoprotein carrier protein LolA [Halobacterium salinarum]|nr:outer membrane lipoprotein carrier protein LolA [Halobacterium salinarum]